ncbi:MAG: hypothetical protein EOM66_08535 [Clostridia bacterium]|nr:hypothetical protein [Candidatus Pelethousia sp.]NCB31440.1 hypothetical protein [Clostridia bacterium]
MKQYYKRGLFDRYDGWRVRNVDAVYNVIPFIMRTRMDSQNLFEENMPLEPVENFIREHRADMPDLSFMHVLMAAMVRMMAERPYLNRFVVWNKIYARNHINISLMIKRKLSNEETMIKPDFEPEDTLQDVVDKVNALVNVNIMDEAKNSMDAIARFFGYIPAWVMRFAIWTLFRLDSVGWLPKKINGASPFHCSAFLTNVGSLGIGPIYHHLYEFGTCSMFVAMGNKHKVRLSTREGEHLEKRFIGLKFVTDERICDGQYYASAMKHLRRLLNNPSLLLEPPVKVIIDDGVPKSKRIPANWPSETED